MAHSYGRRRADDTAADTKPRALHLSDPERKTLARFATRRHYAAGELIFERGDQGATMFVIVVGEVELVFSEGLGRKWLKAGDYFGELSLIGDNHPRTATALAMRETEMLCIDRSAFDRLVQSEPAFLVDFIQRTCRYLLRSEQALVRQLEHQNRELRMALDYLRRTKEEIGQLELLARTDDLTGLYNRRCLDIQLTRFIERAREVDARLALVALDLDHFKQANDQFGHDFGDQVLRQVSEIIRDTVRAADLPCRIGGDEFVVLLFGVKEREARAVAERIRMRIEEHSFRPPARIEPAPITATGGGAMYVAGETPLQLRENADRMLYAAKNDGRNRVHW